MSEKINEIHYPEEMVSVEEHENYFEKKFNTIHYPGAGYDIEFPLQYFDAQVYNLTDCVNAASINSSVEKVKESGAEVIGLVRNTENQDWEIEFQKRLVDERTGQLTGELEPNIRKLKYTKSDVTTALPSQISQDDLVLLKGFFPFTGSISGQDAEKFYDQIPENTSIFTMDKDVFDYHFFGIEENTDNPSNYIKKRNLSSQEFQNAFRLSKIIKDLRDYMGLKRAGRATEETENQINNYINEIDQLKKNYNEDDQNMIQIVVNKTVY